MVGTGRGARAGILAKTAEALQTAHDVKTVVLDKTGTITKGEPEVTDMLCASGVEANELLRVAAALEKKSEHPLARAIVSRAEGLALRADEASEFRQIPGGGVAGVYDGTVCIMGNAQLMHQHGVYLGEFEHEAERLADEGKTRCSWRWALAWWALSRLRYREAHKCCCRIGASRYGSAHGYAYGR